MRHVDGVTYAQDFFNEMRRVLTPDGIITIVTDSLWYGRLLLELLSEARHQSEHKLESATLPATAAHRPHEIRGGVTMYVGKPGLEGGHVVDSSSYFDR